MYSTLILILFTGISYKVITNHVEASMTPCIECTEDVQKITIGMGDAEELVFEKYGNLNKVKKIVKDLRYVLQYEDDGEFETVTTKNYVFKENSFLFLLMVSIAHHESQFRTNVVGSHGELSAFQILPSTARFIISSNKFPVKFNKKSIENDLRDNRKATFLAVHYMTAHLSTEYLSKSLSKYNGDPTSRYGKKIKKTMEGIVSGKSNV